MIGDYHPKKHGDGFRAWLLADLGRARQEELDRIAVGRPRHRNEAIEGWYREAARAEIERRRRLS